MGLQVSLIISLLTLPSTARPFRAIAVCEAISSVTLSLKSKDHVNIAIRATQNASIVFGLLLFWSWYVLLHSVAYIGSNQSLGFGHATRVAAFARHLLSLEESHTIHIISSAPERVFATAIALGAIYRSAEIDPVILQPIASVASQNSRHSSDRYPMLPDIT
jgi:hypothetical protein